MASNTAVPSGYDYDFVEEVSEDYICVICQLAMRNPVQTRCGHQFCKECLDEAYKRNPNSCPVDRQPLNPQDIFPNKFAERKILSFKIKCPQEGCSWEGELRDIESHESRCDYKVVDCDNESCKVRKPRHEMVRHVQEECQYRMVPCSHCKNTYTFCLLKEHTSECPKCPVSCPNNCVKTMKREEVECHLIDECPLTIVPWSYQNIGCSFESRKRKSSRSANIKEITGDLFTCPTDHSLAHCISADAKMGEGIAVMFKLLFGGVNELLDQRQRPGGLAVLYRDQRFIYYLVTKEKYWLKPTYGTLYLSLEAMKNHNIRNNVTHVCMPKIGCGLNSELQWKEVVDILHDVYKDTDIEITVYHYEDNRGAGRKDKNERGHGANAYPNKEYGRRDLEILQGKQSHQMDDTKYRGDMWRTSQGRGASSRADIRQHFIANPEGQQRQNDDEKKRVNTANSFQKKERRARVQEAANSSKSDAKPRDSHNEEGAQISVDAANESPEKGYMDTSGKDVRSKSQRKRDRKKMRMKHSEEKRL